MLRHWNFSFNKPIKHFIVTYKCVNFSHIWELKLYIAFKSSIRKFHWLQVFYEVFTCKDILWNSTTHNTLSVISFHSFGNHALYDCDHAHIKLFIEVMRFVFMKTCQAIVSYHGMGWSKHFVESQTYGCDPKMLGAL